jgi:hypothetical protein
MWHHVKQMKGKIEIALHSWLEGDAWLIKVLWNKRALHWLPNWWIFHLYFFFHNFLKL